MLGRGGFHEGLQSLYGCRCLRNGMSGVRLEHAELTTHHGYRRLGRTDFGPRTLSLGSTLR